MRTLDKFETKTRMMKIIAKRGVNLKDATMGRKTRSSREFDKEEMRRKNE